ncbi:hypothetical protein ZIOFF_031763 [Zingiber officinale]|uniref:Pollen Ole e 1 allergen and extensin family protein n=1 Tax=Zingiber officinale TaxID=94328 RepID=A0A8J5GLV7_ZINOF|nr:hypothetical protein ZIOFF_031763 [Zingiber officinale]
MMTTTRRIGGVVGTVFIAFLFCSSAEAWTGEIRGKVVCDVCGDSSIGPEDHVLKGRFLFFLLILYILAVPVGCPISFVVHSGTFCTYLFIIVWQRLAILNYCIEDEKISSYQVKILMGKHGFFHSWQSGWSGNSSWVGAEVAVLCITKSGEVFNYQAFTNAKGIYKIAETMPESDRWVSCLARPIKSFSEDCTRRGDAHSGIKFSYKLPSGNSHNVKPFLYKPATAPICM